MFATTINYISDGPSYAGPVKFGFQLRHGTYYLYVETDETRYYTSLNTHSSSFDFSDSEIEWDFLTDRITLLQDSFGNQLLVIFHGEACFVDLYDIDRGHIIGRISDTSQKETINVAEPN